MNGRTNLIVMTAIIEMTLVALGAVLWKWRAAGLEPLDAVETRRFVVQAVTMLAYPGWLAAGWWLARKRLASARLTPSAEHLRWFEIGMMVAALLLVAIQGWTARNLVMGETLGRETMLRGVTVFIGVLTAVQGNFIAKVAPPTGVGAPEPGAWSRTMLKIGWGMAAIGLAIVACAVSLPTRMLLPVMLVAVTGLTINSLVQRRRLKPSMGNK